MGVREVQGRRAMPVEDAPGAAGEDGVDDDGGGLVKVEGEDGERPRKPASQPGLLSRCEDVDVGGWGMDDAGEANSAAFLSRNISIAM